MHNSRLSPYRNHVENMYIFLYQYFPNILPWDPLPMYQQLISQETTTQQNSLNTVSPN